MNLSFRSKLLGLVATAGFALAALVMASAIIARRVEGHLDDIRKHYLPKVGLRPQLQGQFERIQRGFQDAVAASDTEKLGGTVELKKEFLQQLAASSDAVEPGLAASLERAIEDFHAQALVVSKQLIAGETGESVVAKMSEMQARQANQMAQSLQRLESERSRIDWLKTAQSALSEQLRGELAPRQVAERAVSMLCRYLECPVGALYSLDADGALGLLGKYALSSDDGVQSFRLGEGLVGQAALQTEIMVVDAPEGQLRVTSALAAGSPRSIALVPLLRIGRVTGVLELASLQPWNAAATELLASVRETLAIALEGARSRAELRALLAKTQRQAEELTRAGAYKSQFLANMSHELRTPLNAILGFTQLLHEGEVGPLTDQQRDFLGNVLTSSRHLLRLINDVLDLAKVESGKLDFRPESIDLAQVTGEVGAILRTTASEEQVRVEMAIDPAIGRVVLDPARLKQVLYNYLSNALKFTPAGGVVTVRAVPEGADFFRIEVHDTGDGIQPEELPRLFVEFQQLDAGAAKKHAGTGLGLALTKRIVEAQGGTVGVRSTPGAGSVFHAVLPRRRSGHRSHRRRREGCSGGLQGDRRARQATRYARSPQCAAAGRRVAATTRRGPGGGRR